MGNTKITARELEVGDRVVLTRGSDSSHAKTVEFAARNGNTIHTEQLAVGGDVQKIDYSAKQEVYIISGEGN